jgi:hypothetical protein
MLYYVYTSAVGTIALWNLTSFQYSERNTTQRMDAYNFIQKWSWRTTQAGATARDNARYSMIEINFFYWKNLIRCLPTFPLKTEKKYSFQVALFCSKHCSMDKSINPEILNKYSTFITENVVCVCYEEVLISP